MSNEKVAMRKLRSTRRLNGLCADCGVNKSKTYICKACKEKRQEAEAQRLHYYLENKICLKCHQSPVRLDDNGVEDLQCQDCFLESLIIIRKLKEGKITNKNLYEVMINNNCTTARLATIANCSQRSVQRWLFENITPTIERAKIVSDFFNVEINDLFPRLVLKKIK